LQLYASYPTDNTLIQLSEPLSPPLQKRRMSVRKRSANTTKQKLACGFGNYLCLQLSLHLQSGPTLAAQALNHLSTSQPHHPGTTVG